MLVGVKIRCLLVSDVRANRPVGSVSEPTAFARQRLTLALDHSTTGRQIDGTRRSGRRRACQRRGLLFQLVIRRGGCSPSRAPWLRQRRSAAAAAPPGLCDARRRHLVSAPHAGERRVQPGGVDKGWRRRPRAPRRIREPLLSCSTLAPNQIHQPNGFLICVMIPTTINY